MVPSTLMSPTTSSASVRRPCASSPAVTASSRMASRPPAPITKMPVLAPAAVADAIHQRHRSAAVRILPSGGPGGGAAETADHRTARARPPASISPQTSTTAIAHPRNGHSIRVPSRHSAGRSSASASRSSSRPRDEEGELAVRFEHGTVDVAQIGDAVLTRFGEKIVQGEPFDREVFGSGRAATSRSDRSDAEQRTGDEARWRAGRSRDAEAAADPTSPGDRAHPALGRRLPSRSPDRPWFRRPQPPPDGRELRST